MADTTSPLRRQVRQAVLRGGGLLQEAAAGFREGVDLLQRGPSSAGQRERELQEALEHGRWLSDEERQAMALERDQQLLLARGERQRRHGLLILLVVALLLPPLWPLALGLTALLLFPRTTRRIAVLGLVLLALGTLVSMALIVMALMAWL
jgi:hypothetical protein